MALNDKIMLKAKANQLGIEGYRTMGEDELRAAVASAQKAGSAPAKGKTATSTNGATAQKGKTATSTSQKGKTSEPDKGKGKTAGTASPAKSTARKATTRKSSAAQGTAKRTPAAAARKKTTSTGTSSRKNATTTTRSTSRKNTTAAAKPAERRLKSKARVDIDRTKIDWGLETNVGAQPGKRQDVMEALWKRRGNYDKVFEDLKANAVRYYPNALNSFPTAPSKRHAAERALRWLIGRVALDYVKATGQHVSGTRAGYGESTDPADIRRRENREEARKEREKAERAAKRAGTAKKGK